MLGCHKGACLLVLEVLTQLCSLCRGVGARALSNGINSAVFFCFFEALRATFAQKKQEVHPATLSANNLTQCLVLQTSCCAKSVCCLVCCYVRPASVPYCAMMYALYCGHSAVFDVETWLHFTYFHHSQDSPICAGKAQGCCCSKKPCWNTHAAVSPQRACIRCQAWQKHEASNRSTGSWTGFGVVLMLIIWVC